jgi:hypothetical protein
MFLNILRFYLPLIFLLICNNPALQGQQTDRRTERLVNRAKKNTEDLPAFFTPWKHVGSISVDSLIIQRDNKLISFYFSTHISHIPIRYPWLQSLKTETRNLLGWRFRNYEIKLLTGKRSLQEYIPNYYRTGYLASDSSRIRPTAAIENPLIKRIPAEEITNGLYGNHIALWHSHGYYYNRSKDRWQWQRARLFETVEDIFPTNYILQYITPMLENAGATVFLPRERDTQVNEVIVDNDTSERNSELIIQNGNGEWNKMALGFRAKDTLFEGENPFLMGTHLSAEANSGSSLIYVPNIPESGEYAVYVSWAKSKNNIPDATYTVNYAGGSASFQINQQMGFGTWIYLGTFYFVEGKQPASGSVTLYTHSETQGTVTSDAIRFGGGMGNVARRPTAFGMTNQKSATDTGSFQTTAKHRQQFTGQLDWKTSGRARWTEGSRYYLQFAGMPDTLVYSLNDGQNDYNDDFMSRGEWVNYLMGSPLGPQRERNNTGLGIQVDLSLAFHTDAGITTNDSVIGTLAIYSAQRDDGIFPDGISRMASRDLSDIVQDQIVNDIRILYNPDWTRRALWDRSYSEAWRPNVPAMLLELLSHQNLADMQYGLDPQFQFDVSRAIYKGIVRFIAHQHGREAVIQPLPPQSLMMKKTGEKTITLSWKPTIDGIEPTAKADSYVVYLRKEGEGFDQGTITADSLMDIELPEWNKIYSFKVTAVNKGGESFPSEILSASFSAGQKNVVLIVNGFDRISGPMAFDNENIAGHTWWDDHAIPYISSLSHTGLQYDFDRTSPWLDDDSPGWGASYANYEGRVMAGNSFDYPFIHGQSIRNAGYSFISVSRQAFERMESISPDQFMSINMIMGKQKGIRALNKKDTVVFRVFSHQIITNLENYAKSGGNILLSGAYIGTDNHNHKDSLGQSFTEKTLGYNWRTNNAATQQQIYATDTAPAVFPVSLEFINQPNAATYHVEAPDGIEPSGEKSTTLYRYKENNVSAGVLYHSGHKAISLGFPFEALQKKKDRDDLMKAILEYFNK